LALQLTDGTLSSSSRESVSCSTNWLNHTAQAPEPRHLLLTIFLGLSLAVYFDRMCDRSLAVEGLADAQAALEDCPAPTAEAGSTRTTAVPGDESTTAPGDDDDFAGDYDDFAGYDNDFAGSAVSAACALLQSGRATSVAACNRVGFFVDSCIAGIDASISLACNLRKRRAAHQCDRAGLLEAVEVAQTQVASYQNAKARAANDSASSIGSAIAVVAVGLASALY
jgi:hypothetical protein